MGSHLVVNSVQNELEHGRGYSLQVKLTLEEVKLLRSFVHDHWLTRLQEVAPQHIENFRKKGIEHYHELAHVLEHDKVWPKKVRLFTMDVVKQIRKMPFMKQLENIYGSFAISNEEQIYEEEIYWRLVRPHAVSDIGPLHADKWFWDLGHGVLPNGMKRIKVWIPLYCESGLNGLRVVPDSHKQEWKYHGEYRDGISKPQLDEKEEALNIIQPHFEPGQAIVFHDKMLHGGSVNQGSYTRVSMEFTMFVKE